MNILIKRITKEELYTIGKLYVDGSYICDTIEDKDRGLTLSMSESKISSIKVYGKTAIPIGTYNVNMDTVSPKFKDRGWAKPYDGKLPRLIEVKGFEGVLIHVGNTAEDSLGCILVGTNSTKGMVTSSTVAFNKLMSLLFKDKNNIKLTIE